MARRARRRPVEHAGVRQRGERDRGQVYAAGAPVVTVRPGANAEPTLPEVGRALGELDPQAGDACFVFLTSHGARAGMSVGAAALSPERLVGALDASCGDRPTVVVVSACYSGVYVDSFALRAPNRVLMSAARPDRASFGCSVNDDLTCFDACLLDALPGAERWADVYERTSRCVALRERELTDASVRPSEPQAWFGADVVDLRVPAFLAVAPASLQPEPSPALSSAMGEDPATLSPEPTEPEGAELSVGPQAEPVYDAAEIELVEVAPGMMTFRPTWRTPGGAVQAVTPDALAERIASGEPFVFLSNSDLCPACTSFDAVFESASTRHPGVPFLRMNPAAFPGIARVLGVDDGPVLFLVDRGGHPRRIEQVPGAAALDAMVDALVAPPGERAQVESGSSSEIDRPESGAGAPARVAGKIIGGPAAEAGGPEGESDANPPTMIAGKIIGVPFAARDSLCVA